MAETKAQWLDRMTSTLGLDEEDILEVAEVFLDTSDLYLDILKKNNPNYDEALRAAHTIKGSAANIGVDPLSDAALSVEAALKKGTDPKAEIAQLLKSFEDFKKLIEN